MAPWYRLDRRRIFLLIFARSLIPLLSPAEASPLGNRTNVFSVPSDIERAYRPLRESHHPTWFMMDTL